MVVVVVVVVVKVAAAVEVNSRSKIDKAAAVMVAVVFMVSRRNTRNPSPQNLRPETTWSSSQAMDLARRRLRPPEAMPQKGQKPWGKLVFTVDAGPQDPQTLRP